MNARTPEGAWGCLARYWRLVAEGTAFRIERHEGQAAVIFERVDPALPFPRDGFEAVAVGQVAFARWLTHQPMQPRRVWLAFPAPSHAGALATFFAAPVRFDGARVEILWDDEVLALPVVEAVPELSAVFERRLQASLEHLARAGDAEVVGRVRAALLRAVASGEPSVDALARSLAMSRRSLQRRLANAGTSYQQRLDETRRAITFELLREGQPAIEEVAFLAGFSESRAFYRAFRRWTGQTPGEWRQRSRSR